MDMSKKRLKLESYFILLTLLLAFGTLETLGGLTGTERPVVTVISCSMYPNYSIGDVVFVTGTTIDQIEEGDVIVFDRGQESGTPIIHRVIEVQQDYVGTQGDRSDRQLPYEQEISQDRIYGEARFRIPIIGYLKLFATDLVGFGEVNVGGGSNSPFQFNHQYLCSNA